LTFLAAAAGSRQEGKLPNNPDRRHASAGHPRRPQKSADPPVQQGTKVEPVINLKAAKALDITFPLALVGRADEVIE
jgi:hypothetical protein